MHCVNNDVILEGQSGANGGGAGGKLTFQSNSSIYSDFVESYNETNILCSDFNFTHADGGGGRQSTSSDPCKNGGNGAPSCGGGGEGGRGWSEWDSGNRGGILDKTTLMDGVNRFHLPLYEKNDTNKQIIIDELDTIDDDTWGGSAELTPNIKNEIINSYAGIYLDIPADL
jgi:hypothetical protein